MRLRLGKSAYNDQSGFRGHLKRFTLYSAVLEDDNSLRNLAFDQLYPMTNSKLLLSLPLDSNLPYLGLLEQVNLVSFEVFPGDANLM